ncbi:MAG: GAF domain-containing protein [Aggregatilineales bacterium]
MVQLILAGMLVVAFVGLALIVVRVIQLPSLRSLEVDVARLAATRAAGVALTARHELATLVDLIMRQAIGLTGAEGGAVCLYEHNMLNLVASHGLSPETNVEPITTSEGVAGQAAALQRTISLPDYALWSDHRGIDPSSMPIHATIAVPMIFSEEVVGVVVVFEVKTGRHYTDSEVAALELLAPQAAIAIVNARVFNDFQAAKATLTTQVEELTMLQRVDQELSATLNLDSVLTLTVDWALRRTGARAGTISITTMDGAALVPFTRLGYPSGAIPYTAENPAPLTWGIAGRAARTRQVELVSDVSKDADYVPVLPGVRAQIAVPMEVQRKLLGVLVLESDRAETFNVENLDFISRLSARAAIALDNARLYRESERLADDMAALYAAGRAISSTLDREELISRAAQSMATLLDVSSALIAEYRPDQDEAIVLGVYRLGTAPNASETLPPVGTTWKLTAFPALRETLTRQQTRALSASEDALSDQDRRWLEDLGVMALALVPLTVQPQTLGVLLALESRRERLFTRDDLLLCESLAGQVAVALRQARLYDEVRELESLKSEMIRMASHDLRGPLGNLMGYLEVLVNQLGPTLNTAQHGYVENIRYATRAMKALIDDLLSLEKIESEHSMKGETFDLAALTVEVVETQQASAGLKSQSLSLEPTAGSLKAVGNVTQMRQAMTNLVYNAIKYTPNGGRIVVRVHDGDHRLQFEVEDNGYGIPLDRQARLFQRFYRAKQPGTEDIPGTGLGLSLVKTVVTRHGGDVWVRSGDGAGSIFGFWLPKPISDSS